MADPSEIRGKILLLADPDQSAAWVSILGQSARIVRSPEEARQALQSENFDWVLTTAAGLMPLSTAAGHETAHAILDAIPHGVCSVSADGSIIWSNAAFRGYPPEVADSVRAACARLFAEIANDPQRRSKHLPLTADPRHIFELAVSGLPGADGRVDRVVGVAADVTVVQRMRDKLVAIDAAGRELVAIDADATARMEVPERLALLEDNLIRYCRELLDFNHFAVLVLDPKTERLETVLTGGIPEQARVQTLYARAEGNGISGYVAATGRSYLCHNVAEDPLYLSGFEGARSSLTVPLRLNERVVGVLNVESDEPAAFNDEDRQVAEIFGRYIAVALHMLKLLVVERSETTGQLAADLRARLAEPLNGIISDATLALQQSGLPDAAAQRLRRILEGVDRAQREIQSLVEAPAIRGLSPEATEVDPLLRGRRILVADDEDIIRETIAAVLSKAGALPSMARDGAEALAMLASQQFDLVLSDIKMPHKSGYEVFAAAKAANAACPVILITGFGYDPEHSIVRASREGLAGVLFKPFKVEQLMELVDKALSTDAQ